LFFTESIVERLREQNGLFRDLPEQIEVPARDDGKLLADATLDDVALAIPALRARIDELEALLFALRRLHDQARAAGVLGAIRIADLPPLPPRMA
jgi:hypothetical protein